MTRRSDARHELGPVVVEGLPVEVTVDAPSVPAVTHARIAVENRGEAPCVAAVRALEVVTPRGRTVVGEFFAYLLPDYDEVRPDHVVVPPGRRLEVELSFAGQPAAPADEPAVDVEGSVDGEPVHVRSPVTLVVRTPRR